MFCIWTYISDFFSFSVNQDCRQGLDLLQVKKIYHVPTLSVKFKIDVWSCHVSWNSSIIQALAAWKQNFWNTLAVLMGDVSVTAHIFISPFWFFWDLERRDLSHKEKLYLRELNVITETQCTLGKKTNFALLITVKKVWHSEKGGSVW